MDNQYNGFDNGEFDNGNDQMNNGQMYNDFDDQNPGNQNPGNQNFGGYCSPNRGPVQMGQRPPVNRGFSGVNMGQRPPVRNPNMNGQNRQFNGNQFGNTQADMNNQFNTGNFKQTQNTVSSYVGTPLDKKGKLGVNFVILGIIAWLMVAGQLTTGLIIFALLCIFIEQDENLTKVMMSAVTFFVTAYMIISGWTVIYNVLYYIVSGAASSSSWFSFMFNAATKIQGGLNSLNGLISRVYDIVVFVVGIKSALAISHGQITESKLVNKIFKIQ